MKIKIKDSRQYMLEARCWLTIGLFLCLILNCFCLSLSAEEAICPDKNGFIRNWLIGGAYPNRQLDGEQLGYKEDFLLNLGGEKMAEPYAGLESKVEFIADQSKLIAGIGSTNEWGYVENKTFPVIWRKLNSQNKSPIINFDKMFPPLDDYIVAYAFCYIESPSDKKIKVRIGSDDDHKIWLNGKLLGAASSSQGIVPDNFIYEAELRRGLNRLLLKIVDRSGGFGFCLALSDLTDKPLRDVNILLDDPKRKQLTKTPDIKIIDDWDHGFFAAFEFDKKRVFAEMNQLNIRAGVPRSGKYSLQLQVTNDKQQVFTATKSEELKEGQVTTWTLPLNLPAGICSFTLRITGNGGSAVLAKQQEILDPNSIDYKPGRLTQQIADISSRMTINHTAMDKLRIEDEQLNKRLKQVQAKIEEAYAVNRDKLISLPKPVDEPVLLNTTIRNRICLNGDLWLVADGKDAKGYNPPASSTAWYPAVLPRIGLEEYFRNCYYPVAPVDAVNPHGQVSPVAGWDSFTLPALLCSRRVWFRRNVDLGVDAVNGIAWNFVCENISGKVTVYLNGEFCGEYSGNIGIVDIPLKAVKAGKNQIDLFYQAAGSSPELPRLKGEENWGIRGDLYLVAADPVHIAEIEVETSWRDATLSVVSKLENSGPSGAEVRLEQYCVLNGRVKYRLPAKYATINPAEGIILDTRGIWKEAKPWGIGGEYGDPVLYDLVSDLYVDEKLKDRYIVQFGFREFWIAGSDFYLNGKRIVLQGDVGLGNTDNVKLNDVVFPLLRADGINTLRNHNPSFWSVNFLRSCDRMGMLAYVQMYPVLHVKKQPDNFNENEKLDTLSYNDWLKHPMHQYNLQNYKRWVNMLRNHPSVIIASTDNEIFTQAWDTLRRREYNIRNDRLGAYYEKYVKSLNPSLVLTRDGDVGTWGHKGAWQETPQCDTANYHYPDFDVPNWVLDWRTTYDSRPVIFGETLYCSYGAWNDWIGAIPSQVMTKAAKVRRVVSLYQELEVPGQIYMGLSLDGFIRLDNTGDGNPWKLTADKWPRGKRPWMPVSWPSQSGPGLKFPACDVPPRFSGWKMINWFDSNAPSHIRNAVNDAYRDSLQPQPPLKASSGGECIIDAGKDNPGKIVTAIPVDTLAPTCSVTAAADGTAWFSFPTSGRYRFECNKHSETINVPERTDYAGQPGFKSIPRVKLNF